MRLFNIFCFHQFHNFLANADTNTLWQNLNITNILYICMAKSNKCKKHHIDTIIGVPETANYSDEFIDILNRIYFL